MTMCKNPPRSPRLRLARRPPALTILELLVVLAMICLLVAMLLPAINEAHSAAWRSGCANQLHQIGMAVEAFHDLHAELPPGWTLDTTHATAFGWLVPLLPFIEAAQTHDLIDMNVPLNRAANRAACSRPLPNLLCPADVVEPVFALYLEAGSHADGGQRSDIVLLRLASCNYLGVFGTNVPDDIPTPHGNGSFVETRSIRFNELERGQSNTLLVGEHTASQCSSAWIGFAVAGEDAAARVVGCAATAPNNPLADESEFSSRHPGCTNFLWADGHVSAISDSVDNQAYRRLAQRGQDAAQP